MARIQQFQGRQHGVTSAGPRIGNIGRGLLDMSGVAKAGAANEAVFSNAAQGLNAVAAAHMRGAAGIQAKHQAIMNISQDAQRLGLKMVEVAGNIQLNDAVMGATRELRDLGTSFRQRQDDPSTWIEDYQKQAKEIMVRHSEGLGAGTKSYYDQRVGGVETITFQQVKERAWVETVERGRGSVISNVNELVELASTASAGDEAQTYLADAVSQIQDASEMGYLTHAEAESLMQGTKRKVGRGLALAAILEDPRGTKKRLEDGWLGELGLTQADRLALIEKAETVWNRWEAKKHREETRRKTEAADKMTALQLEMDDIIALVETQGHPGKDANGKERNVLGEMAVLAPALGRTGAKMLEINRRRFEVARGVYLQTEKLKTVPLTARAAALQGLKAQITGPDAAVKQKIYEGAARRIEAHTRMMQSDPAGLLLPQVTDSLAKEGVVLSQMDPAAAQQLVTGRMLALQKKMGVGVPRVLTALQAKQWGQKLAQVKSADEGIRGVQEVVKLYGPHADQALAEMKMPYEVRLVADMARDPNNQENARLAYHAALAKPGSFKDLDATDTDIRVEFSDSFKKSGLDRFLAARSKMMPWRREPQTQRAAALSLGVKFTKTLMQRNGLSYTSAAEQAAEALGGTREYVSDGSTVAVTVPKGWTERALQEGIEIFRRKPEFAAKLTGVFQSFVAKGDRKGMLEAEQTGAYLARDGLIVDRPGGGFMLLHPVTGQAVPNPQTGLPLRIPLEAIAPLIEGIYDVGPQSND